MSMRQSQPVMLTLLAASAALSAAAFGQTGVHNNQHLRYTQEHGLTFSEIGDVGNPGFSYGPPGLPVRTVGRVDHRYRIATTEITHAQWFIFLNAIAPHIDAIGVSPNDSQLTGGGAEYLGRGPDGVPGYRLVPQVRQYPAEMGWRFAARYTNWLQNGAPTGPDVAMSVFETGAYDASTFTTNPDGTRNDQLAHNADARYWIPTQDEWHKAGYWDPNRHGEGEGGWWLYPNATDETMIVGLPSEGGQTNFGAPFSEMPGLPRDVGSYPEQLSPWGLLDVSGGAREWTDDAVPLTNRERYLAGTRIYGLEGPTNYGDELGWNFNQSRSPETAIGTLRVAAWVPGPGVFPGLALSLAFAAQRRTRHEASHHR